MMGDSLTYHGPIVIGQSATKETTLNVVYDTGSDWLVVEGRDCGARSICKGNTFDPVQSGSYRGEQRHVEARTYGSVSFKGYTWKDKVCVSKSWCANDFEFFVANAQTGENGSPGLGEEIDGIMGMARPLIPKGFNYELGPSFVQTMSTPKFNFHLA